MSGDQEATHPSSECAGMTGAVEVVQADRERARELSEYAGFQWSADHLDMAIEAAAEAFACHRLASTTSPDAAGEVRTCAASPDHADIMETIQSASDDWQKHGYTSALAEVRDMANVGRALMEALPEGYSYTDCPSEIVTDLINERDDARAALHTPPPAQGVEEVLREALAGTADAVSL